MVPSYPHSVSSLMPLDLNEDQNHELSTPNQYHSSSSFSSASLSYPILLRLPDHDQDQKISYYTSQPKPLQNEEAEKIIPLSGSWDDSAAENQKSSSKLKLKVWKKERNIENLEAAAEEPEGGCSVKWMSSKMRMMRKMMVSDHQHKFEDQKQPLSSPLGTDNSNNSNYSNSNHSIRVCSDCHTTKTPLWRSGPRGPKSLCNACGIRQRKARRAMAAAAAAAGANGTTVVAVETTVKKNKLQKKKENKSKFEFASSTHMNKKKRKVGVGAKPISDHSQSRKKLCFEDLRLSLINNFALQQVFPQDEKEAAILLMALSYGLVHG